MIVTCTDNDNEGGEVGVEEPLRPQTHQGVVVVRFECRGKETALSLLSFNKTI